MSFFSKVKLRPRSNTMEVVLPEEIVLEISKYLTIAGLDSLEKVSKR